MSKKKYLVTTSAIISLLLWNGNDVQANTTESNDENRIKEEQTTKVKESSPTEDSKVGTDTTRKSESPERIEPRSSDTPLTNNHINEIKQLLEDLRLVLKEEQVIILDKLLDDNGTDTELLAEVLYVHEIGKFEEAIILYEKFEENTELDNASLELLNLFMNLSEEHTYLTEHNYSETDDDSEKNDESESDNETEKGEEDHAPEKETQEDEKTQSSKQLETNTQLGTLKVADNNLRLTQVGSEPILSEKGINYRATLIRSTDSISTRPYGTQGYEVIRYVDDLMGKQVSVSREAETVRSTYVYLTIHGTGISGWVDKNALKIESVLSEQNTNYRAKLTRSSDSISTRPFGTENFEITRHVEDLVGSQVIVSKEAVTPRSTYVYLSIIGTDISGWVDKNGLDIEKILSEKNTNYRAKLTRSHDSISTRPFGVEGFEVIRTVDDLVGKEVDVTKEAVTPRATYVYVSIRGTNISGWVDKNALEIEQILSEKNTNYRAKFIRSSDYITTRPFGTEYYERIRQVDDLVGAAVTVTREAVTPRSTYVYITVNGTKTSGWVDKNALEIEAILSEKNTHYRAKLTRSSDSISTRPFGTENFEVIRLVGNLVGEEVSVSKEVTTPRSTYVYMTLRRTGQSGWVDKNALEIESVLSEQNTNYRAKLTRSSDSISTRPFGTENFEVIRLVGDLVGKEVSVSKEVTTQRSTYVFIEIIGTNISGWVDKNGISAGNVAYRTTTYPITFEEALNRQMQSGYPQTDTYGGGWTHARRADVAYYLNPDNFVDVSKGRNLQNIEFIQVATGSLNVRTGPSSNYGVLIGVNRNETYEYLDYSNGWYKINVNGQHGWVSGAYVSLISEVQYAELPNSRLATVNTTALHLRKGPSATYDSLGLIYSGNTYQILDASNGWYKLNVNGTIGWSSGTYLNLSNEMDSNMLQFLSLSSPSGISVAAMNQELKGKGILENQGATFIEASRRYNINEIYLLSHALLETGNGASQLAAGVVVNGVTVYNMFGIGAYDGNALAAGSQYAYAHGWTTPEKAIIGGAEFIASSYINNPNYKQDTLYKMKWNPANPAVHQYATDIGWAVKQTRTLDLIIDYSSRYNLVLNLDIPLYN